jgi:hypothetical protein
MVIWQRRMPIRFGIAVILCLCLSSCNLAAGTETGMATQPVQPDDVQIPDEIESQTEEPTLEEHPADDQIGGEALEETTAEEPEEEPNIIDTGGDSDVKDVWSAQELEQLSAISKAASKLEPLEQLNEVEVIDEREEGKYRYIQEKHNVIENKESVLYLGLNDDVLFPGALIQGRGVYDFVYTPIIVKRNPITLSMSLETVPSTGDTIKLTVEDPSSLSSVRQGINDLLKSAITTETKVPAKFSYTSEQVYSSKEMNLALGVSASYMDVSVDYDFNWSTEQYHNKIMSTYKQVYYTVDMDLPESPAALFHPSVGVDVVAAAVPPGSMPMYVSSVSYGWMAVLFIETNFSKEEMDMALNVAYDPAGDLEAELGFGYSTKDVLQSSNIYILVYGGSTAGITSNTLLGYSGLMELIAGSRDFNADSPGVPLSYKLRHLQDNLIAQVSLTEEYTLTKTLKIREFVKVILKEFYCQDADDEGADNTVEMDRFFGWVKLYRGSELLSDEMILNYQNPSSSGYQMNDYDSFRPPNLAQTILLLDLENYKPGSYTISIRTQARDWDGSTGNSEWGDATYIFSGAELPIPERVFTLSSNDFTFHVHFSASWATAIEYCEHSNNYSYCE